MWDPVLYQGLNPGLLLWEHRLLATGPPGKSQVFFFLMIFKIYFNIYIYLNPACAVFVAAQVFSLVVASGGCSLVGVGRLLISVPSLVAEPDSRARELQQLQLLSLEHRLNSCGAWA